jgi:N-acetyl-1-D-myo-inositol-2-amino-2-deoxy-alpha-D-glucopyranoside deacetylase
MSRPDRRHPVFTGVAMAALVAVAAAAGAVSGFVHRTTLEVAGLDLPVGMAAALAAVAGLMLAARVVSRSRAGVLLVGAAYALPVLALSQFRPEGDLVVAENVWGLTLLAGTALVVTVAVTVPMRAYSGGAGAPGRPEAAATTLQEVP